MYIKNTIYKSDLTKHPDWLCGLPCLIFKGYWGSFPWLKWLGHDVDHSYPFRAGVKNK
jgi:hypothetical protein